MICNVSKKKCLFLEIIVNEGLFVKVRKLIKLEDNVFKFYDCVSFFLLL